MHLDDSLGRRDELTLVCDHHEQACAIAAEGYARIGETLGVTVVTTGPGGTNTLTGVLGQWQDSVPALYVSGQVRYDTTVAEQRAAAAATGRPGGRHRPPGRSHHQVRRDGHRPQDACATTSRRRCTWRAAAGRGRCGWTYLWTCRRRRWTQRRLAPFDLAAEPDVAAGEGFDRELVRGQVEALVRRLAAAQRPVVLAGSGVRLAHAADELHAVIDRLGVPVVTAWNAHDLLWDEHPLYVGRPGTVGDRAGNFAVQNADLLVVVGCRLNVRQIGYEFKAFAREAFKAVVDIDPLELRKPTIFPDLAVHADARFFLTALDAALAAAGWEGAAPDAAVAAAQREWLDWCLERRRRYPVVLPEYRGRARRRQPLRVRRQALGAPRARRRGRLRQRRRLRGHAAGAAAEAGPAAACQLGHGGHGLRLARRHRRLPGRRPPRGVPGRRRQHPDEPAGAADDRASQAAREGVRVRQRRLSLHPPDAGHPVCRPPGGRGAGHRRELPRHGRGGRRLRHPGLTRAASTLLWTRRWPPLWPARARRCATSSCRPTPCWRPRWPPSVCPTGASSPSRSRT